MTLSLDTPDVLRRTAQAPWRILLVICVTVVSVGVFMSCESGSGGSLGGTVWMDANHDGLQDAGEGGVSGITVNLVGESGAMLDTTTTGSGGSYNFGGLSAGEYAVEFALLPGYLFSPVDQGADDEFDSDVLPATGAAGPLLLPSDASSVVVDAGVFVVAGPVPTESPSDSSETTPSVTPDLTPSLGVEITPRPGIWNYSADVGSSTCVGAQTVAVPSAAVGVVVAEDGDSFVVELPVPLAFTRVDDSWFSTGPISTTGGSPEHQFTIVLIWDLVVFSDVEMNGDLTANVPDCTVKHHIHMEWSQGF